MKVTQIDHDLDRIIAPRSETRSKGLHVSDIYQKLYQSIDPNRYTEGEPNPYKLALGLAWEAHLEKVLEASGAHAYRPDELLSPEGIAYSPDLIIVNGSDHVGEIKLTFMMDSKSLDDPKFDKWLTQAKAYCYHLGIPRARFYVLFVMGDYKKHRDPIMRVFDIEFSPRELTENWRTLLNFAKSRGMI